MAGGGWKALNFVLGALSMMKKIGILALLIAVGALSVSAGHKKDKSANGPNTTEMHDKAELKEEKNKFKKDEEKAKEDETKDEDKLGEEKLAEEEKVEEEKDMADKVEDVKKEDKEEVKD